MVVVTLTSRAAEVDRQRAIKAGYEDGREPFIQAGDDRKASRTPTRTAKGPPCGGPANEAMRPFRRVASCGVTCLQSMATNLHGRAPAWPSAGCGRPGGRLDAMAVVRLPGPLVLAPLDRAAHARLVRLRHGLAGEDLAQGVTQQLPGERFPLRGVDSSRAPGTPARSALSPLPWAG